MTHMDKKNSAAHTIQLKKLYKRQQIIFHVHEVCTNKFSLCTIYKYISTVKKTLKNKNT